MDSWQSGRDVNIKKFVKGVTLKNDILFGHIESEQFLSPLSVNIPSVVQKDQFMVA